MDVQLVAKDKAQQDYLDSSPLHFVFPWYGKGYHPVRRRESLVENMIDEYQRYGDRDAVYVESEGWRQFGPMSDHNIRLDYRRLISTFDSIQANGYDFSHGYIHPIILQNENNFVLLNQEGWHRTASLFALDMNIPVVFYKNAKSYFHIKRSDVKNWGQVKTGLYSEEQALRIFDYFFNEESVAEYI